MEAGGETEDEQRLQSSFLSWATELGVTDSPPQTPSSHSSCLGHSLYISNFPEAGGRGLAAARDLLKNELILRVPKSALITTHTLTAKDHKLASCVSTHTHLSPIQVLSVCLLAEMGKGKGSQWHPYLMQLPRYYDTLSHFTEFEAQALQVDYAIWATERVISKVESDWEQALPLMRELEFGPQLMTFKSWLWASATVSSRTMHVSWDNAGCLCPVGDLFNYAAPDDESFHSEEDGESQILQSNSPWGDKDAKENINVMQLDGRLTDAGFMEAVDAYCFYARRNYKKGEQVLLSYGTYTNLELLEHYGFHLNVNPNEKAFIPLESGIYSDSWPDESFYIQWDGKPSFALLSGLRLWATPQNCRKSISRLAYSGSQVSTENEIIVMKWLVANCCNVLNRFPSSIEQDVLLLDFIEKTLLHACSDRQFEKILLPHGNELDDFFEGNKLKKKCSAIEFPLSRKARRSIERWKLAIQWRVRYKKMLVQCASYCTEMINVLSSQHLSFKRAI